MLRKPEAELKKKALLLIKCIGIFVFKTANNYGLLIQFIMRIMKMLT